MKKNNAEKYYDYAIAIAIYLASLVIMVIYTNLFPNVTSDHNSAEYFIYQLIIEKG